MLGLHGQIGVFVLEGIEAMRGCGDDRLHAEPLKKRGVVLNEHLEQPILAHAAHLVAATAFLVAQYAEVDAQLVQAAYHSPGDLLDPVVV